MRKLISVAIVMFFSPLANAAGGYVEGKVKMLQVGSGWTPENVYVLVEMDAAVTGQPACATDPRLALNPATELGRALYSALLSAKHARSTVEIRGIGDCTTMGNSFEGINLVRIK